MRYCDYCGAPLNDNDKKCKSCYHECKPIKEEIEMPEPKLKLTFRGKDKIEQSSVDEEKTKKHKKLAGNIIIACVASIIVVAAIIGIALPKSSNEIESSDDYDSSYTDDYGSEDTATDNSVSGEGYYDFDNKFDQDTVDKFLSAYDPEGGASKLGITLSSIDDFTYDCSFELFDRKVDAYIYRDFNGKTSSVMVVDDEKNVVAYQFIFYMDVWTDMTTDHTYKDKQLVQKPAAWLSALSQDQTFDECYDIVVKFQADDILDSYLKKDVKAYYYHDGYTMMVSGTNDSANREYLSLVFMKTDEDFGERHNIAYGQPSIFKAVK